MFSQALQDRSRRDVMRLAAAGVFAPSLSGWLGVMAKAAETPTAKAKAKAERCVLIWLDGGASHKDTWDLKPDSKGAGEFKQIATSAKGVQISEHLPNIAKWMDRATLVRGMSTSEGAHPRAKFHMHTGYREGVGGVAYPTLGSIMSAEKGKPDFALPNFVAIGNRSYGPGFLGPKHAPINVADPGRGVEGMKALVSESQFNGRMGLLEKMEGAFLKEYQADSIVDHKTTYERAVRLMQSPEAKAFDISGEASEAQARYGSSNFGKGVLMARRLIEAKVPFVEINLGGWDTHQDNFTRVKSLSGQIDQAVPALLGDLKDRGLLDSTLVVVMGEFGRTPNINTRGDKPGRDHYPKAWSLFMAGGGVPAGYVHGRTDKEGASVEEGKVSAIDFMATMTSLLGIDAAKENQTPGGRPIRVVDKAAKPVKEIAGA